MVYVACRVIRIFICIACSFVLRAQILVCKTCFFWLRQLRRVRRLLFIESVKTLVHALITSRVDYCNSVFACAPNRATDKLQSVQNAAARLITGTQ